MFMEFVVQGLPPLAIDCCPVGTVCERAEMTKRPAIADIHLRESASICGSIPKSTVWIRRLRGWTPIIASVARSRGAAREMIAERVREECHARDA